jgi:hypothetical protein
MIDVYYGRGSTYLRVKSYGKHVRKEVMFTLFDLCLSEINIHK